MCDVATPGQFWVKNNTQDIHWLKWGDFIIFKLYCDSGGVIFVEKTDLSFTPIDNHARAPKPFCDGFKFLFQAVN